jgi:hypothetical protein
MEKNRQPEVGWLWIVSLCLIFALIVEEGSDESFINPIAGRKDRIKKWFSPINKAKPFGIGKNPETPHHFQSTRGRHIPSTLLINEELRAELLRQHNRFPLATVEHPRQSIYGCLIAHSMPPDPFSIGYLGSARPLVSLAR